MLSRFLLLLVLLPLLSIAAEGATYYSIAIPTRDGKMLAADLYSADSNVAKPTILVQTPYNKNLYRIGINLPMPDGAPLLPYDSLHYNLVVVDWRGFYGSLAAADAGYDRGLDGYDAVEWIAAQRWCNGKVGTWGGSALGQIQFMTARHHPPHLVCAVPMIKDYKTKYTDFYYGGVFRKEHVETLDSLGLADVETILQHPTNDLLWQGLERLNDYPDSIGVPLLMVSGWFDHYPDDVLRAFNDLREMGDPAVRGLHRLIMGPWEHTGVDALHQGVLDYPNAVRVADSTVRRFFDRYLRDEQNGYENSPVVRYYQLGADEWRSTDSWNDLCAGGDTTSLYLGSNGALTFEPPTFGSAGFQYNPRNPSPTVGGSRLVLPGSQALSGPQDISTPVESRSDAMVYTTEPMTSDMAIAGGVEVQLYLSTDHYDTDVAVRLCDVYPDGRSIILTQGIRRFRFRRGLRPQDTAAMPPLATEMIPVTLQNIAWTVKAGHKLRIVVTGSDFPQYDLNPNTGGPLYTPGDTLPANNTIYYGNPALSRLIFPVVSGTGSVDRSATTSGARIEEIAPNPASSTLSISFSLLRRENVAIDLIDNRGSVVANVASGPLDPGTHGVVANVDGLPAGLYICRMKVGGGVTTEQVVIAR